MEAEKIVLPNGSSASLAASHTLTDTKDAQVKMVPVPAPATNVVVFLIGGAGDKKRFLGSGPNGNIAPLQGELQNFSLRALKPEQLPNFSVEYKGYYEAFEDTRIAENFISVIPSKRSIIYLIGHSLGGWNGAHLSRILTDKGYNVKMLITLDPVGQNWILERSSKIYDDEPSPKAKQWINVYARPSSRNFTDVVAWAGSKWEITSGPQVNISIDTNHAEAPQLMFRRPESGAASAYELLTKDIIEEFSR